MSATSAFNLKRCLILIINWSLCNTVFRSKSLSLLKCIWSTSEFIAPLLLGIPTYFNKNFLSNMLCTAEVRCMDKMLEIFFLFPKTLFYIYFPNFVSLWLVRKRAKILYSGNDMNKWNQIYSRTLFIPPFILICFMLWFCVFLGDTYVFYLSKFFGFTLKRGRKKILQTGYKASLNQCG